MEILARRACSCVGRREVCTCAPRDGFGLLKPLCILHYLALIDVLHRAPITAHKFSSKEHHQVQFADPCADLPPSLADRRLCVTKPHLVASPSCTPEPLSQPKRVSLQEMLIHIALSATVCAIQHDCVRRL